MQDILGGNQWTPPSPLLCMHAPPPPCAPTICFCAISLESVFDELMTLMAVSSSRMLPSLADSTSMMRSSISLSWRAFSAPWEGGREGQEGQAGAEGEARCQSWLSKRKRLPVTTLA